MRLLDTFRTYGGNGRLDVREQGKCDGRQCELPGRRKP
jgi:hypothetical protein